MSLRVAGTIVIFLFVFLGLIYKVGDVGVRDFFVCLGLGSIAGLIAWFKFFKPGSQRKGN